MDDMIDEKMFEMFFEESLEGLEENINCVIDLEKGYDKRIVDNIMRSMHSIKGGSAMVGLCCIEKFSHKLEDTFVGIKNNEINITTPLVDVIIESLNTLKKWLEERKGRLRTNLKEITTEILEEKNETEAITEELLKLIESRDNKREKIYRIDIYLDKSTPMFEIKRFMIERNLSEHGKILKSNPDLEKLSDQSKIFYKIIYKTISEIEDVIRSINVSDVLFTCIKENTEDLDLVCNMKFFVMEEINYSNIVVFYESFKKALEETGIDKLELGAMRPDVYGIQLIESIKKSFCN